MRDLSSRSRKWIGCSSSALGCIQYCTVVNRDEGASGLGASRVATGILITVQIGAGLGKIYKNYCVGWLQGIVIGDGVKGIYGVSCTENGTSRCFRGISVSSFAENTLVKANYFEGGEAGTGGYYIRDAGRCTKIKDNILQSATSGQAIGIDLTANQGYGVCSGNDIQMPPGASDVIGIYVVSSSVLPVTISDNAVVWNGTLSQTGCVGIQIAGVDPLIYLYGNKFNPNGQANWAGSGAGCFQVLDNSSASLSGSTSDGTRGFGVGVDNNSEFPYVSRGAVAYYRNNTALGNSAYSGGVLTLNGKSTYNYWDPTSGTLNVTSIVVTACAEGHIYLLRILNSTGNSLTLTASGTLILASTFTVANTKGGMIKLIVDGGVVYEISRTIYP